MTPRDMLRMIGMSIEAEAVGASAEGQVDLAIRLLAVVHDIAELANLLGYEGLAAELYDQIAYDGEVQAEAEANE